jgi:hypothetical protein
MFALLLLPELKRFRESAVDIVLRSEGAVSL